MSSLVSGLSTADPTAKAEIYRDLGLRMEYHHETGEVGAEISTAEACAKRVSEGRLTTYAHG
jgi:hypothetical protein